MKYKIVFKYYRYRGRGLNLGVEEQRLNETFCSKLAALKHADKMRGLLESYLIESWEIKNEKSSSS